MPGPVRLLASSPGASASLYTARARPPPRLEPGRVRLAVHRLGASAPSLS
eukprot:CAMPEP_0172525750 /NCGR_PEP_ID=MMETSP1067-20121228/767_1 /TAXON_ID=265564 ORGANISM="Thalassiosira punctigera, Strain Tpunct2005C2" /NCGR_SAMPLE_ID=MMETSP1067 /ASSEMBLY_ACC=CAM_ASM_000444 /LENGTH=49 /DNA_ID= /DNA_START= /DNA_END= /DNA_ORIENTATION=